MYSPMQSFAQCMNGVLFQKESTQKDLAFIERQHNFDDKNRSNGGWQESSV